MTFEAISQQKSTCSTALCSNCCTKDSQPSLHGRFVEQVVSHTQKAHQDHRPHPSNQQHMAREEKNKPDKKPQLLPLHYSRANSQPVPGGSPWAAPCQEKRMADERRESHFEEDILSGCLLHFHWRVLHFTGDLILVNPMNAPAIPYAVTGGGSGVMPGGPLRRQSCTFNSDGGRHQNDMG